MARSTKAGVVSNLQATNNEVIAAVIQVKAKLSKGSSESDSELLEDLQRVIDLMRTHKTPRQLDDASQGDLDSEGVSLWNLSTGFRPTPESTLAQRKVFALARLCSYRLIEAGLDPQQDLDIEALIKVLQIASKTAAALIDVRALDMASSLLTSAAALEEKLQQAEDSTHTHAQSRAVAIVGYYISRMEGAWAERNEPVSYFMLTKALDDSHVCHLPSADIELLASRALDIGRSYISSDVPLDHGQTEAGEQDVPVAIKWLQQAFSLADRLTDQESQSVRHLKTGILKALARGYFQASASHPDSLARAEAALAELEEHISDQEDVQQLLWMKLSIRKRRKAGEREVEEVVEQIIKCMSFSEGNVTELLQELNMLTDWPSLLAKLSMMLLERALDSDANDGQLFVDRILMSFIFVCSSHPEGVVLMPDVERMLTIISQHPTFKLEKVPTTACQSLLFQLGTRFFQNKKYTQAADWLMLSTHATFEAMAAANSSKCFRKTALCYIQAGQYAKAASVIASCPGNESATYYVMFLCSAHQGMELEAIDSVRKMTQAPDFDRKMLLLATKVAHESQMRSLVLAILQSLLDSLKMRDTPNSEAEALTLVRCMIRVLLELVKEPLADVPSLISQIISHFQTAIRIAVDVVADPAGSLISRDLAWLWRVAYNTAIQGCSGWDSMQTGELFAAAHRLLELYAKATSVESKTPEMGQCLVLSAFSSICCRAFGLRRISVNQQEQRRAIVEDVVSLRSLLVSSTSQADEETDKQQIKDLFNISFILQVEQITALQDWDELQRVVEEATDARTPIGITAETLEGIADALWSEPACPTHHLFAALERILKSSVEKGHIDRDCFSRWLRALVTMLLSRGKTADRAKALSYANQAIEVMKSSDDDDCYPEDEQQWLLATCYNSGVEALQTALLDQAKEWFETSVMIARLIPNETERAQKVEQSYRELLARYGGQAKADIQHFGRNSG